MSKETTPVKTHGGLSSPHDAKRIGDYTVSPRPWTTATTRTTPNPSLPCRTYLTRGPRVIADTWGLSCFTSTLGA